MSITHDHPSITAGITRRVLDKVTRAFGHAKFIRSHPAEVDVNNQPEVSVTGDAATERDIARAIWCDVLWCIPDDREVQIRICGHEINVKLEPQSR